MAIPRQESARYSSLQEFISFSNKTDSSESKNGFTYGFKEKVTQNYLNKTINLPTGKYLVSKFLDKFSTNLSSKSGTTISTSFE